MAVLMDNASEVSSRERVQFLYNKNVELETKRRKSAQAKIPSDPNVWQQLRENFETIILEDHAFAEQHEIELALWQLHYRQIEELRANFNASMAVASSPAQSGKTGSVRSDRVAKIRSQLKTFLSEATGFYHELMLKIRAKYGLPLGHFSDDPENEAILLKEGFKSAELKKGLISCHRCLIYLGDVARYKGIYGEEESKPRDFAAASGYYMQASSFWPSSGNPHHQLAILASYSGDEFVAIYRYFRSLAVETPFSMARDNLIIAFEKNRLSYTQQVAGTKTAASRHVPVRMNGKGRARAEARFSNKDHKVEAGSVKDGGASNNGSAKTFTVRFVRLHGILFTRTSMETFAYVLSKAKNDFLELLSSRSEIDQIFGSNAAESELFIVRLVAIIIFSVHNASREPDDQSHAENLQRAVLLQNARVASYEFMGLILERCLELQDPLSSFLLPGVLVFVEWLACCPESVYVGEDEKLAKVRASFWKNCVSIFNKLVSSGLLDEAEFSFINMSRDVDGETANQLALWEDNELRGFLPLQPAQQILDFSRKNSLGFEGGNKAKKTRLQRIIAAGKTLSSVVRVGKQVMYLDLKLKKFVFGAEPELSCELAPKIPEAPQFNKEEDAATEKRMDFVLLKPPPQLFVDGEDEEEEIVFKPSAADKIVDAIIPALTPDDVLLTVADAPPGNLSSYVASVSLNLPFIVLNISSSSSSTISSMKAMISQPPPPRMATAGLSSSLRLLPSSISLFSSTNRTISATPLRVAGAKACFSRQPSSQYRVASKSVRPDNLVDPLHLSSKDTSNGPIVARSANPPIMPAIMTPGGPLDLSSVLFRNRIIFVGQPINSDVAQRVISQLLTLATIDEDSDILMYLNCPGGSAYSVMAVYDCMSWIKPKVGTVCFGVAASQGALLLAGGEKGMRYAMPNARIMIHQPQSGCGGHVEDVRRQVNEAVQLRHKIDNMFAAFTGQPLEKVQQYTDRDRFLSTSEAMEFGLIDGILETEY